MIIHGFNPVMEALRADPKRIHFIAVARDEKGRVGRIVQEARKAGIPVRHLPADQVERLAGSRAHNGVVADLASAAYADFDTLMEKDPSRVMLLDGVQDPQNLGAILRVADGFGFDFVALPEHDSAGLTGGTAKAAAGATEWVPVCQVTNLSRSIERLKAEGFWIYGASEDGEALGVIDFRGKVALVMGSEDKGLRRNVAAHCDRLVKIPMRGRLSSFNVATAAAVLAWEVDRQNLASREGKEKLGPEKG